MSIYYDSFKERLDGFFELITENREKYPEYFDSFISEEEVFIANFLKSIKNEDFTKQEIESWMRRANEYHKVHKTINESGPDGIQYKPDLINWVKIDNHIRDGHKIHAIKEYRKQTDAGLKESKNAVDKRGKILGI